MYAIKFTAVAKKLIENFCKEKGTCTYTRVLEGQDNYDATTGVVTEPKTNHTIYIAFTDIADKAQKGTYAGIATKKAYIAGDALSFEPSRGDYIEDQQGKVFLVVSSKTNMFRAFYLCYLKEIK